FSKDAAIEAIDAGIGLLVIITEGIPVQDSAEVWARAQAAGNATRIIGPNCPGIITPAESLAGIIPATSTARGKLGRVSRSATLTYQMRYGRPDLGSSSAIGIAGHPVIGTTHLDALEAFDAAPDTAAIVLLGQIGGDAEEGAAP